MSRIIMVIPTSPDVALTTIIFGMIRAIEIKGINLSVFKPVEQHYKYCNKSHYQKKIATIIRTNYSISNYKPLSINRVQYLLSSNQIDNFMDEIIFNFHNSVKKNTKLILVEGLAPTLTYQFTNTVNYHIAKALNAEIIFLISLDNNNSYKQLNRNIQLIQTSFGGQNNKNIKGVIINNINMSIAKQFCSHLSISETSNASKKINTTYKNDLLTNSILPVIGHIPMSFNFIPIRAIDICYYLNAQIINKGEINTRYIESITFCYCNLLHTIEQFKPNSLIVTSGDRTEILIAICLAAMNKFKISAILLTGGYNTDIRIKKLCESAFHSGLPIFMVHNSHLETFIKLKKFNIELSRHDIQHIKNVQVYVSSNINVKWIESLSNISANVKKGLSPPMFRYQLAELARKANKRIVLPEGYEPRTLQAASICTQRRIASCILLGNSDKIMNIAEEEGIKISNDISIIDPESIRNNYVNRLIELRKSKGMLKITAEKQLEDNVILATMMLECGEVDGLVSGAVNTTANTIRPPLQLIKMAPNTSLVSSIFFMLFPKQVLVYGDCAINPNPNSEQLAEIAIQSADSAAIFGIEPRIAMICYSTGNSSSGSEVEKVRKATYIAQQKRPDLIIDGPLQYDAAIITNIAKIKAPNSPVAGRATVFIFPDLNTGNTTYKAVQRSANLVSIGPILQGMRKPVNDLSRGALVEDIVYTIAVTAIQAYV